MSEEQHVRPSTYIPNRLMPEHAISECGQIDEAYINIVDAI